jgi:NADH:ubiquinone oxidoreductase subunit 6 (subunit J)
LTSAAFLLFFVLTIGSALGVLWSRNVLYSAFGLILTFLGVAALYVLAGADFLAVAQIMVYIGGILVLLVFGVMLTNQADPQRREGRPVVLTEHRWRLRGVLVAGGIFALLMTVFAKANFPALEQDRFEPIEAGTSVVPQTGLLLMSDYGLPFEVAGLLLLIALIGAAYLAKKGGGGGGG